MLIYRHAREAGISDSKCCIRVLDMLHDEFNDQSVKVTYTRREIDNGTYYPYILDMAHWCNTHTFTLKLINGLWWATYKDDDPLLLDEFDHCMLLALEIKLKRMLKRRQKAQNSK